MLKYDIGIIGGGVAGIFAALKIVIDHKNIKTIVFDTGRPHGKRRLQMNGYLGAAPSGDGKLYINNIENTSNLIGVKNTKISKKWFYDFLSNIVKLKIIKDKSPS